MNLFWLVCLFVCGGCLGRLANLAIHSIRLPPRQPDDGPRPNPLPCRRMAHAIPIVGWIMRAREAPQQVGGIWLRPLAVELLAACAVAFLYWWEVQQRALLPAPELRFYLFGGLLPPRGVWTHPDVSLVLHVSFAAHAGLFLLMLIASMIDIDEMIIPDVVTVPGTLAALAAAAVFPWSLLPGLTMPVAGGGVSFLTLAFPADWPAALDGAPRVGSLLIGVACFGAWCAALLPWFWRPGLGTGRAVRMLLAYVPRRVSPWGWFVMPVVGAAAIAVVWYAGGARWAGLLSALVGMAFGGGLVWVIRILGGAILRREAMGFGDVTLLAMIGAWLGWQAALVVFFLAPLAALLVGVLQWIIHRDNAIPYGPYLCLAAVAVIVGWAPIWQRIAPILLYGSLVPTVLVLCIPPLAAMLYAVRLIKALFHRSGAS